MNTNRATVAVLLAAYNGLEWIDEQVTSILNQEQVQLHLFISVDLSTDDTYQWCKRLSDKYTNISILEYGERYGGAAKNFYRLVKEVDFRDFDYVCFADQDDVWHLNKLFFSINKMCHEHADAYSASVVAFWPDGRQKLIDKSQPQKQLDYLFEAAGPGCTYVFSNKAACHIRHYLEKFPVLNNFVLHDWLSYAILRHDGYTWYIDSEPKMRYRQHDANQVGANTSIKGIVYRIKYIFSDQVFESIDMLTNILGISSINLQTRLGVLKLASQARQLRRRKTDQVMAFFAISSYLLRRQK